MAFRRALRTRLVIDTPERVFPCHFMRRLRVCAAVWQQQRPRPAPNGQPPENGWRYLVTIIASLLFAKHDMRSELGGSALGHAEAERCRGNALNHAATGSISQPRHAEYACSALHYEFARQVQERACARACLNHWVVALRHG